MKKQTLQNIVNVRAEALEMLDTIGAVKGDEHMNLVKALLLASNATDICATIVNSSGFDQEGCEVLNDGVLRCLHGMLRCMQKAGGIPSDVMCEAIADAESINSSVSGLMRRAVDAGERGVAFGGDE